ncbi:MAG: phage tail spike protein, partial [Erysipelotrichaceae bacterium]
MIQLYKSGNNDFSHNGDIVIEPISCILKCELNGIWEVELVSTLDCELITENAVISCDTPNGKNQLFRIYDISKTDNQIAALAYPIFIDSKDDVFIFDKRPTNKNGQQALDDLMQGTKYHGQSDIVSINSAYYINKNLIEALNSDDNQSFINRWGGECSYNNYTVTINNRIGSDNGARAEFGYNLIGIKEDINMLTVVTRIVPMAYNGHMLPRSETVDSPIVNNYPKIYTKVIKFEDVKLTEDAQEGETSFATLDLLYAELRKRSQKEFENGIDKPKISYDVDIIDLSRVDEYKYLSNLVKLHLGDTVHCKHRRLNIETNARVVSLTYDCVLNKVENLELGDYEPNYFNDVSATQNAVSEVIDVNNKSVLAEKIYGVMNAMNTQLKYQKDIAHKQDVRAILFEDLDTTSPTFGAMCIGSLGFQISSQRNTTNSDWVWSTFGTGKGFSASLLNAGTIQAIDIKGVNVTSSNISGGNISGTTITGTQINGNTISGGNISGTNINGGSIVGTTITGNTSINVGTDLTVGNNITLGTNNKLSKSIKTNKSQEICFFYNNDTNENYIIIKPTSNPNSYAILSDEAFYLSDKYSKSAS